MAGPKYQKGEQLRYSYTTESHALYVYNVCVHVYCGVLYCAVLRSSPSHTD